MARKRGKRHTLAHEIRNLQQLNAQMAQEALNLTRALKGDNKTQGNWGEVVLTRVLEASGLREGYEYQTQVSIETDNRARMQPDVIVRLPQGKDVVIDAKMTLVAYERYFNAEDDYTREAALQEHIASVRNHMRLLGRKDYQQLPGLRSLDYVLMFIPVEPAFLLAIDRQPELISEALKNNIMLVSPTTLLVALRTIANLWRYEHQSRNAQKIAERAGRLYDKMRLFVDDMSAIGQGLDKAQDNYRQAMKKLASGRGNLLVQAESFRELGVEVKREINPELVEQATAQDEEYRLAQGVTRRKITIFYPILRLLPCLGRLPATLKRMGSALNLLHSTNIFLISKQALRWLRIHKKRRILAFRLSPKSRKLTWWRMYFILWPQNMT